MPFPPQDCSAGLWEGASGHPFLPGDHYHHCRARCSCPLHPHRWYLCDIQEEAMGEREPVGIPHSQKERVLPPELAQCARFLRLFSIVVLLY